jgi:hypothetical protein
MGRVERRGPGAFDEKQIKRMLEARLEGTTLEEIARAHGTSVNTVRRLTGIVKLPRMTRPKRARERARRLERGRLLAAAPPAGTEIHENGAGA